LDAKENRYNEGKGNETWYQKWRSRGYHPLEREIANESTLKFSIPEVESVAFSINIIGATPNSSRVQETLTFSPGDILKESAVPFISIRNIVKSAPTQYDITVLDADGNTMSLIPNHKTYVLYHWIQIFDWDNMYIPTTSAQIEVLYKKKFDDLVNDYDEFLFGDKYDKAIYWKYLAHQSKDPAVTMVFEEKCNDVLNKIEANGSIGLRRVINFKKSPFIKMPYGQPFGPVRRG